MEWFFQEWLIILVLILANGFFAGAELAVISARKSLVASLATAGNPKAKLLEKIQQDPHRFLATVQIGVTVVSSLASAVGGAAAIQTMTPLLKEVPIPMVQRIAEPLSIGLVVATISYLFLVLGELAPKTIGLQYADRIALVVARPIHLLSVVAIVAVRFLTFSNRAVLALLGIKPKAEHAFVTREEVQQVLSEGSENGALTETEHRYIENIFEFTHTTVREVMVPRTRIIALDLEMPRDEIFRLVRENMYSRYPVYRGDLDHVVGFVHTKDILLGGTACATDFDIGHRPHPPLRPLRVRRTTASSRRCRANGSRWPGGG